MNTDQLLQEVDQERRKFTSCDKDKLANLVQQLVDAGVYPAISKIGEPALKMVEGWGARWHEWREPLECPCCHSDLRSHEHGPPFKREIGMYSREQDRTTSFVCPDCGGTIWELFKVTRN